MVEGAFTRVGIAALLYGVFEVSRVPGARGRTALSVAGSRR
jgi:hypothetical protein